MGLHAEPLRLWIGALLCAVLLGLVAAQAAVADDPTFDRAFGAVSVNICSRFCASATNGGAAGQLFWPAGAAVSDGELFVVDDGNHRVSVFSTAGLFLRAFGKGVDATAANADICTSACKAGRPGAAAGQLNNPYGIAISAGEVYVSDRGNSRIAVFTTAGSFVRAFGKGVDASAANADVCSSACQAGVPGAGAGNLYFPGRMSISQGEVYVVDGANHRIAVFTTAGSFVRAFGKGVDARAANANVCTSACESGTQGNAAGELNFPSGATVTGGEVYVLEQGSSRVSVFTAAGIFTRAFGKGVDATAANADSCTTACEASVAGGAAGRIFNAMDIAVSDGELYLAEQGSRRIDVFTTAGTFLRAFGGGVDASAANADICTTACEVGSAGGLAGQLKGPEGVAVSAGEVYVADQSSHRLGVYSTAGRFLRAVARNVGTEPFVCNASAGCQAGAPGGAAGQLDNPDSVAVSGGELYVSDIFNQRVDVFTTAGTFVRGFGKGVDATAANADVCSTACEAGSFGGSAGQLGGPHGVAVSGGRVFVSDAANYRISEFTTAGAFVRAFGKGVDATAANADVCTTACEAGAFGSAAGQLLTPAGIAVSANELYVADVGNHRISVFTTAGAFVRAFGKGVDATGADGDVCTTACEAGIAGGAAGRLHDPRGVTVSDGQLFVADQGNHRISVFTTAGAFLRAFGDGVDAAGLDVCATVCDAASAGSGAGQLDNPYAVTVGGDDVYVSDRFNARVSVFTTSGSFVRAFGKAVDLSGANGDVCSVQCQAATTGGGAGSLGYPAGIVASAGELYVAEDSNDRISVYETPRTKLSRSTATMAFDARAVDDGESATQQALVTNAGTRTVTLTGTSIGGVDAGDFQRVGGQPADCETATVLTAGDSCSVRARFDPTTAGAKSATIAVASNAPTISIALTGTATRLDGGGDAIPNRADPEDGTPDRREVVPTAAARPSPAPAVAPVSMPWSLTRRGRVTVSSSGGRVRVVTGYVATCPAGGSRCSATLTLTTRRRTPRSGRTVAVVLTRKAATLAPGSEQRIGFVLSALGARVLRQSRSLTATLRVSMSSGRAAAVAHSAPLRLRAPS